MNFFTYELNLNLNLFKFHNIFEILMRLFKDVFTGEDIVNDAFPIEECYDGTVFEIKSNYINVGNDNIDIGIFNIFNSITIINLKIKI